MKHPLVGIQNVYHNIAKCFNKLYSVFIKIISNDLAEGNIHNKLAFWTVYSRGLALGLNSNLNNSNANGTSEESGQNGKQSGRDEDDFDEGGPGEVHGKSDGKSGGNNNGDEVSTMTYQVSNASQFVLFYRDFITRRTPYLSVTRVQIKQTALKLLVFAMNQLLQRSIASNTSQIFFSHFDLNLARSTFQHSLSQVVPNLNNGEKRYTAESLVSIPTIPIILFLQDLINLSCACATFTMNDKAILGFQSESMKLVCILLEMFADAVDPDYVDATAGSSVEYDDSQNKLVVQYLSQLLGAIRVCLTMKHFPELLLPSQKALFVLVQKGYIRDKVAFKRLLKPIMTYAEESLISSSSSNGSGLQLKMSSSLNEVMGIHEHLAYLSSLAGLMVIGNHHNSHPFTHPHQSNLLGIKAELGIKQTILNSFSNEITERIICACKLTLIDLIRILFEQQKAFPSSAWNLVGHGDSSSSSSLPEFHPARGGWIYSSAIKIEAILQELITISGLLSLAFCYSCNRNSGVSTTKKSTSTAQGFNYKDFPDDHVNLLLSYAFMMISQLQRPSNLPSTIVSSLWSNVLQLLLVLIEHPSVLNGTVSISSWISIAQEISKLSTTVWRREYNGHYFEFVMKFAKLWAKNKSTDDNTTLSVLWQLWKSRGRSILSGSSIHQDNMNLKALESLLFILALHQQLTPSWLNSPSKVSNVLNTLRLLSIISISTSNKQDLLMAMQASAKGFEVLSQALTQQLQQNPNHAVEFVESIVKECQQFSISAMQTVFNQNNQQILEVQQSIFEAMLDAWMKLSVLAPSAVSITMHHLVKVAVNNIIIFSIQ
jgi:hypothetical protein